MMQIWRLTGGQIVTADGAVQYCSITESAPLLDEDARSDHY